VASGPEAIRATRNLLLLVRTLGEIEPALLNDLTRAVPKLSFKRTLRKPDRRASSNC